MNKKAQVGFIIRMIAGIIIVVSTPFLVVNPYSIYAQVSFALGGFLFVIGGITP